MCGLEGVALKIENKNRSNKNRCAVMDQYIWQAHSKDIQQILFYPNNLLWSNEFKIVLGHFLSEPRLGPRSDSREIVKVDIAG